MSSLVNDNFKIVFNYRYIYLESIYNILFKYYSNTFLILLFTDFTNIVKIIKGGQLNLFLITFKCKHINLITLPQLVNLTTVGNNI